ncbi:MAG: hypothetical protein JJ863_36670 [Deltaproteobacteria bacterium]|nr:hypothetical protein [Deltaproteobacteria bacterium]
MAEVDAVRERFVQRDPHAAVAALDALTAGEHAFAALRDELDAMLRPDDERSVARDSERSESNG